MASAGIRPEEAASWENDGFFVRRHFAPPSLTKAMLDHCVGMARAARGTPLHENSLILGEANLSEAATSDPEAFEERASKIFRLHRRGVFREFIVSEPVLRLVEGILGPEIDCFLSQFIFKNPGAWGQPWHQDAYYFPFDRTPQVGLWLAVTDTTHQNGPLHVLAGSHREPLHAHVRDRRENANYGYMEIVDHDMRGSMPVLMEAGDLLVFHSHLMHSSTDNVSNGIRAAMVYHCAERGTRDLKPSPTRVIDWMPLPSSGGTDA